jgi:hypothetical protein
MKDWNNSQDPTEENFPLHLTSYEELEQHFRAHFHGLNTTEKGRRFASAMVKLIPQTEVGANFALPIMNEKISGDGGVDMKAIGRENPKQILYIQSKLRIDRTDDIDSILSKFQAYEEDHLHPSSGVQLTINYDDPPPTFLVVTLSSLRTLLKKYESRSSASKSFYQQCCAEHRIHFIDGYDILSVLRTAYKNIVVAPYEFQMKLESPAVSKGNVFLGIISSDEIKRLYNEIGDALFFDNVRDFRGTTSQSQQRSGRTTPNDEIVRTLTESPEKMLERNNGVVFKAHMVSASDDLRVLTLTGGNLINGCQTSMCIVNAATTTCYVSIKVVQTSDAWDITKAANYQNSIDQIDLDIARSVRPQLLKRAGAFLGTHLTDRPLSAFQIIDDIYNQKVTYAEVRLLFIGVFSKDPNNVFEAHYRGLMQGLVEYFYEKDKYGTKVYEVLFTLQDAIEEGIENARKVYSNTYYASEYERLYEERSLTYRCYIGILAICAAINVNIAISDTNYEGRQKTKKADENERKDDVAEFERMEKFLEATLSFLQVQRKKFIEYYLYAVKVWMDAVSPVDAASLEVRVNMHTFSRNINFTNMFKKVCREADLAQSLSQHSSTNTE